MRFSIIYIICPVRKVNLNSVESVYWTSFTVFWAEHVYVLSSVGPIDFIVNTYVIYNMVRVMFHERLEANNEYLEAKC